MPRFFTLAEAQALLPEIEKLVRQLHVLNLQRVETEAEMGRLKQRILISGGLQPPREQFVSLKHRKQHVAKGFKESLDRMRDAGCVLKDAEAGLVDFPTLYNGAEVCLCWRLGESDIAFWHSMEDGFRGRRPIDADFLARHRGDAAQ